MPPITPPLDSRHQPVEQRYLHVKFSDDEGRSFTSNGGDDKGAWIGMHTSDTNEASASPSDYAWHHESTVCRFMGIPREKIPHR